jgi:hypothetical protein
MLGCFEVEKWMEVISSALDVQRSMFIIEGLED